MTLPSPLKLVFLRLLLLLGLAPFLLNPAFAATPYVFRQFISAGTTHLHAKTFTAPGFYYMTAPANSFTVTLVGAGGGGSLYTPGGPGAEVSFQVSGFAGDPLFIIVGAGGTLADPSNSTYSGGIGGGYSLVALDPAPNGSGVEFLGVAGGGGGAGGYGGDDVTYGNQGAVNDGGLGGTGGPTGSDGVSPSWGTACSYQACPTDGTGGQATTQGNNGQLCYNSYAQTGNGTVTGPVGYSAADWNSGTLSAVGFPPETQEDGGMGSGGSGGGGSGYYGGGAGTPGGCYAGGGGGGGGSSYVIPSATSVTEVAGGGAPSGGNGEVTISW